MAKYPKRLTSLNVAAELDYIVQRAQHHAGHVVEIGSLVFFSTHTGDAWMLDAEDSFAVCLARNGQPQVANIEENSKTFRIEWDNDFFIEKDKFCTVARADGVTSEWNYPTRAILEALDRWRKM